MNPRNLYIWLTTVMYMTGAIVWIFLSDALLAESVLIDSMLWFSIVKDIFFVVVTTVFLVLALHAIPENDHAPKQHRFSHAVTAFLMEEDGSPAGIYLFAIVLPIFAALMRLSMPNNWHHDPMLELFMFPIILSALIGGVGPGLVSTTTSAGLVLFVMGTLGYSQHLSSVSWLPLSFLLLNGILVSVLSGSLRQSVHSAQRNKVLLDCVVNGTSDAIFVKDIQGRYLLANPVMASFLGRTEPVETIVGKTDVELFEAASVQDIQAKDREVLDKQTKLLHEERLRTHAGEERIWAITKGPIWNHDGAVIGLFGFAHDITTLRQTLAQLQSSEERFRLTLEAVSDGFWDWNVATGEVFRSSGYMQVMGHSPDSDTHDFAFLLRTLHPDDKVQVETLIAAHLNGETPSIRFDARIITAQQETRWIRARGRAIERDASGRAKRVLGTIQNITDTHRNTQDLQLVLNEAYEAIWIMNSSGQFLYANPSACTLCGYTVQALEQLNLSNLLPLEEQTYLAQHTRTLTQRKFLRREWTILRQDGQIVLVDVLSERLQDGRVIAFGRDLTEEKKMLNALRQREQQLARVLEGSDQGFWEWHLPSNHFSTSERFATMMGYAVGTLDASIDNWPKLVHEEDLAQLWDAIERHKAGLSTHIEVAFRMRRPDGDWHWILSRGRIVERAADGTPLMMSGTHTDYNERKSLELLMQQSGVVFDHVQEAILITAPDGAIRKVNPAFERITGYTEAEVLGQNPRLMGSQQHSKKFFEQLFQTVSEHGHWQGEIWNRQKNERIYPCRMSISEIRDNRGELQLYVGVLSDITKEKAHETELHRMAHHDLLTGLPNRLLLGQHLIQALTEVQLEDQYLAVCFLDLDGFKAINDHYGHHIGDRLLIHIADKLRGVLRQGDLLARPGGDEFVLLLSGLDHPHEIHHLAEQILSVIQSTTHIDGHDLNMSASMGITLHPSDGADADTLLRHADQAMYMAKEMGKNRYVVFDPVHDKQLQAQRDLLKRLQQAYEQQEFVLFYQPKVDLSDGRVIGAEALIRWQHPERGLLAPGEFIHALDNSALEPLVGNWVIANALKQLSQWQVLGVQLQISVNIGAGHLLRANFVQEIQAMLQLHDDIQPDQFEIEILETAGLGDMDKAIETLKQCHNLGISFALDDFGTGYSSLAYFRKLPVQMIKIDQSFVRNMLNDHNDFDIVESVVRLARAFNRPVIAEGVETMVHGMHLLEMGCHLAQGYGIAKPMPAHAFLNWMEHWKTTAPWSKTRAVSVA